MGGRCPMIDPAFHDRWDADPSQPEAAEHSFREFEDDFEAEDLEKQDGEGADLVWVTGESRLTSRRRSSRSWKTL
jgi:hypothetical protein